MFTASVLRSIHVASKAFWGCEAGIYSVQCWCGLAGRDIITVTDTVTWSRTCLNTPYYSQ
jgi:hypothetical protein